MDEFAIGEQFIKMLAQCEPAREIIVEHLGGQWGTRDLRETCRDARVIFELRHDRKILGIALEAIWARNLELCRFALEHGAHAYSMITVAGMQGFIECCKMTFNEFGDKLHGMIEAGAKYGHMELCEMACAKDPMNREYMLRIAAFCGRDAFCDRAIELGARDFEGMLDGAAGGGHVALCMRARSLGAHGFELMLSSASAHGQMVTCELAIEWGARCFESMRSLAKQCNHPDILARADELLANYRESFCVAKNSR
jgi:hypothetical protein